MIAPALSSLLSGFGSHNSALSSLTVSIYVVGFALAPMLVAPLSELYGRAIIYNVSNFLFLAFTAGCASSVNIGMFIAFRFLSGCAGITPAALLGGSIGDLMPAETMGKATALVATGSLIAPVSEMVSYAPSAADQKRLSSWHSRCSSVQTTNKLFPAHCPGGRRLPERVCRLEMGFVADLHSCSSALRSRSSDSPGSQHKC